MPPSSEQLGRLIALQSFCSIYLGKEEGSDFEVLD